MDLYFQEIGSSTPLTTEEEGTLTRQYREGDLEARNKLIAANLKFVVKVAGEFRSSGANIGDLIGAGNLGC